MSKTAVYLRVSSKSQKVASQKREIQQFLDGRKLTEVRWFVDEGASGKSLDRPALQQLRAAVFNGEVDTIVVYALDRIARNALEGMNLLADWLKAGVRLIVITLQMDFNGDVGQMVASLLFHIAQMERNRIRERQAAGIAAARANGKRWGGRKRGTFKIDPAKVQRLADKGLNYTDIARALGVHRRTVKRMLAMR